MGSRQKNCSKENFTVIEMLFVIAIIGLLIAIIGGGAYNAMAMRSATSRTVTLLNTVRIGLETYKEKHGYYPLPHGKWVPFTLDSNTRINEEDNLNGCIDGYLRLLDEYGVDPDDNTFLEGPYRPESVRKRYFLRDGFDSEIEHFRGDMGSGIPKLKEGGVIFYRYPGIKNPNSYDLFSAGPNRKVDADNELNPDDIYANHNIQ